MRKGMAWSVFVLTAALALSGCTADQGDVGNKNIRPNNVNNNGLRFADDQANEMNRRNSRQNLGGNIGERFEMSREIADRLAAMPEIDSAYVMLTGRNAYVAVAEERGARGAKSGKIDQNRRSNRTMRGHGADGRGDVSDALKTKVADQVRAMAPDVDNVYVSANPDFYSRMRNYAADLGRGNVLGGLATEFNALVQRIFPEAIGTRDR